MHGKGNTKFSLRLINHTNANSRKKKYIYIKLKLRVRSPQANYTDRATAACRLTSNIYIFTKITLSNSM
jgi:hypothetical protein